MNLPPPSGPPAGSDYRPAAEPGSGSALKRAGSRYSSWPLWAKIAAPGAAAFVGLGAVGAATEPAESADPVAAESVQVTESSDLAQPAPSPTAEPTTTPPQTTAPTTTTVPTTGAPTLPPTTAAPTLPPTTAAPTLPPTTEPPPPPPPPPAPVAAPVQAADPDYGTCKEAKAHGAGPYIKGQDPEYNWYRDADNDGIVCE